MTGGEAVMRHVQRAKRVREAGAQETSQQQIPADDDVLQRGEKAQWSRYAGVMLRKRAVKRER